MVKPYFILFFLITSQLFAKDKEKDACQYKKYCNEMSKAAEKYREDKSKSSLMLLIAKAKELSQKSCRIRGVRVNVSRWRACHDQGFSIAKGKLSEDFKGPYSNDEVLGWFFLIKNSKTQEGKAFLNSDIFTSTLDGGLVCEFIDSDAC